MTETPVAPSVPGEPAPLSLPARLIGVLISPRETYRHIVAHPRWFGALAVTVLIIAAAYAVFLRTEVGQQATLDQQVAALEGFGQTVGDAQYEAMRRQAGMAWIITPVTILVMSPLMTAIFAGILYGVFGGLLGGEGRYKQVFTVLAHAGVVSVVQALFVMPLNYARGSMSSPTNLSVFLPMLEEGSFLASLLGAIDLFIVWWIVVAAIGLGVLYKRRTGPIAWSLLAVYLLIALVIAAVKSMLGSA